MAARRIKLILIASEILNATVELSEVLRQIHEQRIENLASNKTPKEKGEVARQLQLERNIVQRCYSDFLQRQRTRVMNLGYSWPSLENIQAGRHALMNNWLHTNLESTRVSWTVPSISFTPKPVQPWRGHQLVERSREKRGTSSRQSHYTQSWVSLHKNHPIWLPEQSHHPEQTSGTPKSRPSMRNWGKRNPQHHQQPPMWTTSRTTSSCQQRQGSQTRTKQKHPSKPTHPIKWPQLLLSLTERSSSASTHIWAMTSQHTSGEQHIGLSLGTRINLCAMYETVKGTSTL